MKGESWKLEICPAECTISLNGSYEVVARIPLHLGRKKNMLRRAKAITALPDCLEALQVIEQLTRGTLSTHVHNVAVNALKKAGCV